ncbi:ABC transporter ATP-binding protein [Arthrobacter sp. NPDC080031]|uniref:ABC transporter ATP-binding protein n=1 Tax=Arthrobacter sp. NPDC080031 TaxID=3155918 RepID=UPI0034509150
MRNLHVVATATRQPILHGIDLELEPGRVLGIVGESGSGKSTLGLALLGYSRPGTAITKGSVMVDELDMLTLPPEDLRQARGARVAYVPQDPGTALNPKLSLRTQLKEGMPGPEPLQAIRSILRDVGLPDDDEFLGRKPRELSGGQQQRIGIAMAVAPRPKAVVLDEPTTGLDVTTQRRVLDLVTSLTKAHGISAIYISHDLAVVAHVADDVAVMKDGLIVESGPAQQVLTSPAHEYTKTLIAASPTLRSHLERVQSEPASEAPVFTVSDLRASYGQHEVLHGIDFELRPGECVAVVGESGSGKSTMSRSLIGLHAQTSGSITLGGRPLSTYARRRSRSDQRRVQYIFQNPYASLQPRRTIGDSIAVAVRQFGIARGEKARQIAADVLERVELPRDFVDRYPAELSGGQRQRVAIARALATQPEVLICDEITSALDVSVQAAILKLLSRLHQEGLATVFITHNLAVVSAIADRVIVVEIGTVVESGPTPLLLTQPQARYTRQLLENTLDLDEVRLAGRRSDS